MASFVARLRLIALVVAAGLALTSTILALKPWQRWQHPELTVPLVSLIIGHMSIEQKAAMRPAALAHESARGRSGLFLAALGTAASAVLLIVFGRCAGGCALPFGVDEAREFGLRHVHRVRPVVGEPRAHVWLSERACDVYRQFLHYSCRRARQNAHPIPRDNRVIEVQTVGEI